MFTIEQIAETLNVKKVTAYGLVRFLEAKGVLKTERQQTGLRGKPRNLYTFVDSLPALSVAATLFPLFEASEQAPAAASPVAA